MNEILQGKGVVKVAEDKVLVTGLKGPLEEGWQQKVEAFATRSPQAPLVRVWPPQAPWSPAPRIPRPEPSP